MRRLCRRRLTSSARRNPLRLPSLGFSRLGKPVLPSNVWRGGFCSRAPGVFHQRISHTGPDTAGGGTTGGITAMEEKKKKTKRRQRLVLKMRVWSRKGGDGKSFLEFRRFILDMRDGTRHQLTALNDGVNYKMAGC